MLIEMTTLSDLPHEFRQLSESLSIVRKASPTNASAARALVTMCRKLGKWRLHPRVARSLYELADQV